MIDPPTPPPKIPAKEFPSVPRLLSGMAAPAAFPPIAPLIRLMRRLVVSMTLPPRMINPPLTTAFRGATAATSRLDLFSGIAFRHVMVLRFFEVDRHITNQWWQELSKVTEGWRRGKDCDACARHDQKSPQRTVTLLM